MNVAIDKGTTAVVVGMGKTGLSVVRYLLARGAVVRVTDNRSAPPELAGLRSLDATIPVSLGRFDETLLEGCSLVVVSPGVATNGPFFAAAHGRGLPVVGDIELFTAAARAPIAAITGTNGKTTVTALTGQLIERAGKSVAVAGNIGPSLLDTLQQHLDAQSLPDVWVLELSSFQLDAAHGFEPTVATVLNLTQDHLDWHGDMDAYAAAKARVFGQTGVMVLNRDDARVAAMRPPVPAKPAKGPRPPVRSVITFGGGMPAEPGDFGIEVVGGNPNLFHKNALRLVHWNSGGIPRVINTLCELALVYGYADGKRRIVDGRARFDGPGIAHQTADLIHDARQIVRVRFLKRGQSIVEVV